MLVSRDIALVNLGDRETRRSNCDALFELARRTNDDRRLAEAFRIDAKRRADSGDQQGALEPARHAAALAVSLGDRVLEADSLALTALALVRIGDVDSAIATIEDALRAAGGAGDRERLGDAGGVDRCLRVRRHRPQSRPRGARDRGQSTVW